jgi:hypothetical protein
LEFWKFEEHQARLDSCKENEKNGETKEHCSCIIVKDLLKRKEKRTRRAGMAAIFKHLVEAWLGAALREGSRGVPPTSNKEPSSRMQHCSSRKNSASGELAVPQGSALALQGRQPLAANQAHASCCDGNGSGSSERGTK